MAAPRKRKGIPKTAKEWDGLTSHEVMAHVLGKKGQKALQKEAQDHDAKTHQDYRLNPHGKKAT